MCTAHSDLHEVSPTSAFSPQKFPQIRYIRISRHTGHKLAAHPSLGITVSRYHHRPALRGLCTCLRCVRWNMFFSIFLGVLDMSSVNNRVELCGGLSF
jgi:hypothetical protein